MYAVEKLRYALCNLLDVPGMLVGLRVRMSHVSVAPLVTCPHTRPATSAAPSVRQYQLISGGDHSADSWARKAGGSTSAAGTTLTHKAESSTSTLFS